MHVLVGGRYIEEGRESLPVYNPVTEQVIDTVPKLTSEDVDEAIRTAAEGQREWAAKTQMERNQIMRRFAAYILERRGQLGELLCQENGKRVSEAEEEFDTVCALVDSYCDRASHLYGDCLPNGTDATNCHTDLLFTRREPLGVIACLLPFNFPIELCAHKIIPALVTGNAVVIKPPSDCPLAIIRLVECLHEAGVPAKAAQVVTGSGAEVGNALVVHPGIQALTMTGGTETGVRIAQQACKNLTRTFLELGGNDAFLVLEDANLDLAVENALESRVNNAGQVCCASKRYFVHESVAKAFTEKLIAALRALKIGDPMDRSMDIGSMISRKAADEVAQQIRDTVELGANCVFGGERIGAAFLRPAVLTDVTGDMPIAQDMEVFGAVFPIIRFRTTEEAIALANHCSYGLNGAVFSRDTLRAISVAAELKTGGVVINGGGNYRTAAMPFGGYKKSGIGREGSAATLEEMTQVKTYVLKGAFGALR